MFQIKNTRPTKRIKKITPANILHFVILANNNAIFIAKIN